MMLQFVNESPVWSEIDDKAGKDLVRGYVVPSIFI